MRVLIDLQIADHGDGISLSFDSDEEVKAVADVLEKQYVMWGGVADALRIAMDVREAQARTLTLRRTLSNANEKIRRAP